MLHLVRYVYQNAQIGYFFLFTSQFFTMTLCFVMALCSFGAKHVIFISQANRSQLGLLITLYKKLILRKLLLIVPQLHSATISQAQKSQLLSQSNHATFMQIFHLSYKWSSQMKPYSCDYAVQTGNLSIAVGLPTQCEIQHRNSFSQGFFLVQKCCLFPREVQPMSLDMKPLFGT